MKNIMLKVRRIQSNLTQKDLALILGVHVQSISSYERGLSVPNPSNMAKIAKALHCTVDELFFSNKE